MKGFAELILSLCDLAEAEGRVLRENIRKVGSGCLLSAIGILFLAAALAFLVASAYKALNLFLPQPLSLLLLSVMCALMGIVLIWSARSPKKDRRGDTDGTNLNAAKEKKEYMGNINNDEESRSEN